MKALYLNAHADDITKVNIEFKELPKPIIKDNECLIKVSSSGINPSDALAATGYFKHANLPRIPGRDFAGTVVEGPKEWVGKKVWGTGGAAGISFDGTQAEFIKLKTEELAEIPNNIDLMTAGAQLLPFVTAYMGLVKRAHIKANEVVLVSGALGQVGQAVMSICNWKQCKPIALVQGADQVTEATKLGWKAIDSADKNLQEKILAANDGNKIQVIFNSLGNLYWKEFMNSLAEYGRIITISARENMREVTINLFEMYRANQDLININTVPETFADNAAMLNELKKAFEEKKVTPLALSKEMVFTPENANAAYQKVMKGSQGKRIVIEFK